ncbi:DUF544 domain protein [Pleurostoma richardsiae]|uniref:DUF544 domain protein n=1 Tax=Pleurostoma richardsiae TaxID=41990 RepID=A0AA38R9B3_9PEZI|nr:DUF544 domain protein [Pleurostoma richardsiae]
MVTRKPLPANAAIDTNPPSQVRMQDIRQELWSATESDTSADKPWADVSQQRPRPGSEAADGALPADVPASLRPGGPGATPNLEDDEENVWGEEANRLHPSAQGGPDLNKAPPSLRPGAGGGAGSGVGRTETNPFKRKPSPAGSRGAVNVPPVPPPPSQTPPLPPSQPFAQMNLSEGSNNPWQPALGGQKSTLAAPAVVSSADQESGKDIWDTQVPSQTAPAVPVSNSPALLSLPSEEGSADWGEVSTQKADSSPLHAPVELVDNEALEDSNAWDDLGAQDKGKAPMKPPPIPTTTNGGPVDDWNLIDNEPAPGPPSRQSTWENFDGDSEEAPPLPARQPEEQPPSLPPRKSVDEPPAQPPRPAAVSKAETYQIKNINWYDINAAKNPRTSPILVQNANGPCPLVALVNALTLTTPPDSQNTALVETLRSREQVSLGLLLEAVIEELMSSRRTNPDVPLPDVFELYNFLQGLHTGMNVNPRFIPTAELVTAYKRTSLTHLHPTERGDLIPGTFEDTKEMSLYATFSIPLLHGWLPSTTEAAYEALSRRAVSYEDAQNLLFREEELEEKLSSTSHQGLTEEEQEIYQDILTIKSFLSTSATQLTPWGLEVITKAIQPGSVAILFRNDHFSTLYRHPQTLQLFGLVTDAGYASHDEVVWESLVDVNGERSEFFSGDFRVVGGAHHQQGASGSTPGSFPDAARNGDYTSPGDDGSWTTVQGRQRGHRSQPSQDPPVSPKHEQEDRDLALALQLQEEEDERHRAEQARRRRESLLSEQYIEQQAHQPTPSLRGGARRSPRARGGAPVTPHRRSSSQVNIPITTTSSRGSASNVSRPVVQQVRPLVPPVQRTGGVSRPAEDGLDEAPPSYEQAAKQTPYVPPAGHPNHPASSPGMTTSSSPGPSTPSTSSTRLPRPQAGYPGTGARGSYRQGVPPASTAGGNGRDRDCVVM